jgi:hypothetical protein
VACGFAAADRRAAIPRRLQRAERTDQVSPAAGVNRAGQQRDEDLGVGASPAGDRIPAPGLTSHGFRTRKPNRGTKPRRTHEMSPMTMELAVRPTTAKRPQSPPRWADSADVSLRIRGG